MFGRQKRVQRGSGDPVPGAPRSAPVSAARRHGRRPMRSSVTGPYLANPDARIVRFELAARSALEVLQGEVGDELRGVHIGFATAPTGQGESEQPMFYSIDRASRTILLFRMPIQRAKGLHVDDAEHRAYFIGHCVHRAVCEYLGRAPWEVAPGRFDHF